MSAQPIPQTPATPGTGPRLLDRGDAGPTADVLVGWARRFILFHDKAHPTNLGLAHVTAFLEHIVRTEKEPLLVLTQARSALTLLYGTVLGIDLGELPQPRPPLVLDQLRLVLRLRHYSPRTEDCYVQWARRFILFHDKRHPRTLGAAEVERFLTHLAVPRKVLGGLTSLLDLLEGLLDENLLVSADVAASQVVPGHRD